MDPLQELSDPRVAEFCRRWKVAELALFGSALRADFGPESDIDVLVTFTTDADWGLLDHVAMEQELTRLVGRKVDLVTRKSVEASANWMRRNEILGTARPIHATR